MTNDVDPVNTWKHLPRPSWIGEVIKLISNLKQKQNESVQAFWDRVNNSFHEATKKEMLELAEDEAVKRGAVCWA